MAVVTAKKSKARRASTPILLTEAQVKLLSELEKLSQDGRSPSMSVLGWGLGCSAQAAHKALRALARHGIVTHTPGRERCYAIDTQAYRRALAARAAFLAAW